MANILFVMRYPLQKGDNLKLKFDGQIAAAKALGHQAYFIGWDDQALWLMGGEKPEKLANAGCTRMPAYEHTVLYWKLMKAVRKAVARLPIDAIYMRSMPTFSPALSALREAKRRGAKLIVEHPTYPFEAGKVTSLLRKPVFCYADRVFAKIEPMIDLYALIGDPVEGTLHGRPAMNIVNGVSAELLPLHAPRPEASDIVLLALASMSRWQGYDRLLQALGEYRGEESVTLHMVGDDGDGSLPEWKQLAQTLGLGNRVQFHAAMHGAELDRLVEGCDVGVGGVGLLNGRQYVSTPLKLREYMARGLPFVYGVEDAGMPEEPRFCLHLPNDGKPVDLPAILAFAKRVKQDAQAPHDMRRYAEERLSWKRVLADVFKKVGIQ